MELVSSEGVLDREKVNILVEYFTERSLRYLDIDEETEDFTRLFYQVSVACIADPLLQNECLDDIIHLRHIKII